jgi:hypothetical protein
MAFQAEGVAVACAVAGVLLVLGGLIAAMCLSRRPDPKMKFLTEMLDRLWEKDTDD